MGPGSGHSVDAGPSAKSVGLLGYVLAALLIAVPLADAAASLTPLRPGDVTWRVGAVGVISRAMLLPGVGAVLGYAVALRLEQWRVQWVVSFASALAALASIGALVLFTLDALETRAMMAPADRGALALVSIVALGKLAVFVFLFGALAAISWRTSRRTARARRAEAAPPPLVVSARSGASATKP